MYQPMDHARADALGAPCAISEVQPAAGRSKRCLVSSVLAASAMLSVAMLGLGALASPPSGRLAHFASGVRQSLHEVDAAQKHRLLENRSLASGRLHQVCRNFEPGITAGLVYSPGGDIRIFSGPAYPNTSSPHTVEPSSAMDPWFYDVPTGPRAKTRAYLSSPLEGHEQLPEIETALIAIHGSKSDADAYFCRLSRVLRSSPEFNSDISRVLLIAPRFEKAVDVDSWTMADFDRRGLRVFKSWVRGSKSVNVDHASTIDVVDAIVELLQSKATPDGRFPKLRDVVLAGHSAGAQMLLQHAVATRLPIVQEGSPRVRWILANPGRLLYLDNRRWAYLDPEGPYTLMDPTHNGHGNSSQRFFCELSQHDNFNHWHFGLGGGALPDRLNSSAALAEAVRLLPSRDVTVLAGTNDTCNLKLRRGEPWRPDPQRGWPYMLSAGDVFKCAAKVWKGPTSRDSPPLMTASADFSFSCPALLQGPWRLKRIQLYRQYLREFYGKPDVWAWDEVPGVGHCEEFMFRSPQFMKALTRAEDE